MLTSWLNLVVSEQGILSLLLHPELGTDVQSRAGSFCSMGSGDLTSGPHACSADASSPQEAILPVLQNSPLPNKRQARLHTKPTREQFCKLLTCDHQERHPVLWVIVRSAEAWGLLVRWPSYPSTHGLTSATPMEELRRLDAHCAPDSSCRLQASVLRWMSLNYPVLISAKLVTFFQGGLSCCCLSWPPLDDESICPLIEPG